MVAFHFLEDFASVDYVVGGFDGGEGDDVDALGDGFSQHLQITLTQHHILPQILSIVHPLKIHRLLSLNQATMFYVANDYLVG